MAALGEAVIGGGVHVCAVSAEAGCHWMSLLPPLPLVSVGRYSRVWNVDLL